MLDFTMPESKRLLGRENYNQSLRPKLLASLVNNCHDLRTDSCPCSKDNTINAKEWSG
jgi:hypothetical protein